MDVRPTEQRLIDVANELPRGRALCNTAGRGQLAAALAARDGQSPVTCFFLDLYQLQESRLAIGQGTERHGGRSLQLVCQADPPPGELDLVCWIFSRQGDAELAREILQTGHERLAIGGRLAVAIDNPRDQWLHEQLQKLGSKITRQLHSDAVVYLTTKTKSLKKHKDYSCELAFRDGERLIQLRTRPGVFSHREVDGGARALVKAMQIQAGQRVLDLGCGSGAVGIAAALRAENVQVHAIDSNPRAVEAAQWAADRNGVASLTAAIDCDDSSLEPGSFDLVLTNPPYYSNFRIAGLFLNVAHRALKPGGQLLVVTKTPEWYHENLPKRFDSITEEQVGTFRVLKAIRA